MIQTESQVLQRIAAKPCRALGAAAVAMVALAATVRGDETTATDTTVSSSVGPVELNPQELQRHARRAARIVLPAIVAVAGPTRQGEKDAPIRFHTEDFGSGVIIRADGLVLSQWHVSHQRGLAVWRDPGDFTEVVLQDGRRLKAQLLGAEPSRDLSLLKIVEPGDYPYVSLANDESLDLGDWVLAFGHPLGLRGNRGPVARLGRAVHVGEAMEVVADCLISPGDSGGPLIDLAGNLVGALGGDVPVPVFAATPTRRGVNLSGYWGARTIRELIPAMLSVSLDTKSKGGITPASLTRPRSFRNEFYGTGGGATLAGSTSGNWTQGMHTRSMLREAVPASEGSVVEVLHHGKRVAFGTVASANGWIVTKASETPNNPECQFSNGQIVPSTLAHTDAGFDLAVLHVDVPSLHAVHWSTDVDYPIGTIVVAPDTSGDLIGWGMVSVARRKLEGPFPTSVAQAPPRGLIKPARPELAGQPTSEGLSVTFVEGSAAEAGLRVGDVIVAVDGKAVEPHTAALKVRGRSSGATLTLMTRRESRLIERALVLKDALYTRCADTPGRYMNYRFDDFPVVFEHDIPLALDECGGPLVGLDGSTIGITIARVGEHGCMAIPAEEVKQIVARAMSPSNSADRRNN